MGVDAQIRVNKKLDIDERMKLSDKLLSRFNESEDDGPVYVYNGSAVHIDDEDPNAVTIYNRERYYGPGYERGRLPMIAAICEFLEALFPGLVYYGPDTGEELGKWTEVRPLLWKHFTTDAYDDYHAEVRRFNASQRGTIS